MAMIIPKRIYLPMLEHAITDAPDEAVGILAGRHGVARHLRQLRNISPDPEHRYQVADQDLYEVSLWLDELGMDLAGIYHSHADGADTQPSMEDRRVGAGYPDAVHIIISVGAGAPTAAAWRYRGGGVLPERLQITP